MQTRVFNPRNSSRIKASDVAGTIGSVLIGRVTQTMDEDGYCKVTVPSICEDMEARVMGFGLTNGVGFLMQPLLNSQVLVMFEDAKKDKPIILGSVLSVTNSELPPQESVSGYQTVIATDSNYKIYAIDNGEFSSITIKSPTEEILLDREGIQIASGDSTVVTIVNGEVRVKSDKLELSASEIKLASDKASIEVGNSVKINGKEFPSE